MLDYVSCCLISLDIRFMLVWLVSLGFSVFISLFMLVGLEVLVLVMVVWMVVMILVLFILVGR